MYRDQGRRTCRVDGHRLPVQAEHVGDAARGHTRRQTGGDEAFQCRRASRPVSADRVERGHQTNENPGAAAANRQRIDAGRLETLPSDFQQHSLLRVHRQGLARRYPEEPGVEIGRVDEPAYLAVRGAQPIRIGIVEGLQIPTAVCRERRHHVPTRREHIPQPLRTLYSAGKPARHTDHRDGLPRTALELVDALVRPPEFLGGPLKVVAELFCRLRLRFALVPRRQSSPPYS